MLPTRAIQFYEFHYPLNFTIFKLTMIFVSFSYLFGVLGLYSPRSRQIQCSPIHLRKNSPEPILCNPPNRRNRPMAFFKPPIWRKSAASGSTVWDEERDHPKFKHVIMLSDTSRLLHSGFRILPVNFFSNFCRLKLGFIALCARNANWNASVLAFKHTCLVKP